MENEERKEKNHLEGIPLPDMEFLSSSSSSEFPEFLSESEPFEIGSEEELVPKEIITERHFLSSDTSSYVSSGLSSTSVSPVIHQLNRKISENLEEKHITFGKIDDKRQDEQESNKQNSKETEQSQTNENHGPTPLVSQNSIPTSSYTYCTATPMTLTSSVTYSNMSTSPIRFNNSPLRKTNHSKKTIKKHKKMTHTQKKKILKIYVMSQAGKGSDDSYSYSYEEEEDVMNSSDRRFIADSSSQSQFENEPALYRLLDMSQRKPNPNYKVNKRKRLIDEYSPSQTEVEPSLSEE